MKWSKTITETVTLSRDEVVEACIKWIAKAKGKGISKPDLVKEHEDGSMTLQWEDTDER